MGEVLLGVPRVTIPSGSLGLTVADVIVLMKGPDVGNPPLVKLLPIQGISVGAGGTTSLASYVQDPNGLITTSQLLENGGPLSTTLLSYSHNNGSYTITGISPGSVSNLTLQVTY